jgi:hypothetical protein
MKEAVDEGEASDSFGSDWFFLEKASWLMKKRKEKTSVMNIKYARSNGFEMNFLGVFLRSLKLTVSPAGN